MREPPWKRLSRADERVGLVDRLGAGEWPAREVQEVAAQPALHHPVGRHRRVEPARQQDEGAPARADRQPARAAQALAGHEHLLVIDLDVELEVRRGQVDLEPEPQPHGVSEHARQLHRVERIALVAPPRADGEGAPRAPAQQRHGGVGRGGRIALAAQARLHHAHARQRQTALDERLLRLSARHDEDAAAAADLERPEVAGQPAQIALEHGDERGPVAALQCHLAVLEQYAALRAQVLHGQKETSAWMGISRPRICPASCGRVRRVGRRLAPLQAEIVSYSSSSS